MKSSRNGKRRLQSIEGFMFDLDGTLVLSDRSLGSYQLLPGAAEVLHGLQTRGIPFVVLTNGTAYPPADQAKKLRAHGLPIPDDAMLTPSSVAADLMSRRGINRVLVLGIPGVGHALKEAGIEVMFPGDHSAENAQAVFIGWHPDCNMKDIEAAVNAIWDGAQLYVASDVPFFATAAGKTMGYSHAIAAAVRKMTRAPMVLTGKPSLHALRLVSRKLNVPMSRIGVIGDDPLVEISMALRGGAMAFGVSTGMTRTEEWAAQPLNRRPHQVVHHLMDLLSLNRTR